VPAGSAAWKRHAEAGAAARRVAAGRAPGRPKYCVGMSIRLMTINLEDPDLFNRIAGDFSVKVEAGRWPKRDPRA